MTATTATDPRQLAALLDQANRAYYEGRDTGLSDTAFDTAKRDLADLAAADPAIAADPAVAAALTQVGATSQTFAAVTHDQPMASLDNVFSADELAGWAAKTASKVTAPTLFSITPKLDGLSLSVLYVDGHLARAATRGDGTAGEDVTAQAKTIANLPHVLSGNDLPHRVEVRGEVVISKVDFEQVNADRVADGGEPFANRRNAAAGSLRQKDPAVTASRRLSFFAFGLGGYAPAGDAPVSDHATFAWMEAAGLPTPDAVHTAVQAAKVVAVATQVADARDQLPYDTDGVVVKVEDAAARTELGGTSRAPSWAIALKPAAEQATTTLTGIELQVGRTGRVTPRAVLDPVEVGGVTVTYATLNNASFIEAKDVRIGDTVVVQRAGDVIPEVVGPVAADRDGTQTPYQFPSGCPVCADPLDRDESADARCVNVECASQLRSRLIYWASRKVADVDGLGAGLIDRLLDAGLVTDEGDLLHLTVNDLVGLDRVGDRLAVKVVANLADAVERLSTDPVRLLASLSIRMNGRGQAKRYLEVCGTADAVIAADQDTLETARDIGPERARRMHDGLRTDRVAAVLAKYRAAGVRFDVDVRPADPGDLPLDGLKVVLTGTFDRGRDAIRADLEALGAQVSSSLSSSTDVLLAGDKVGASKLAKAAKASVPVVQGQDALDGLLAGDRTIAA